MEKDYLLIGVDTDRLFSFRFACLNDMVRQSIEIQKPHGALGTVYADMILGSALLGSRADDQESILFKLKMAQGQLRINCEAAPLGALRSAIYPAGNQNLFTPDFEGFLHVVKLKRKDEVYETITEIQASKVEATFQEYLRSSVQTPFHLHWSRDVTRFKKNYGLWVEKLPGTTETQWKKAGEIFVSEKDFLKSIQGSDDPDLLMESLFKDTPFEILAVTHPRLYCPCSKEAILKALAVLPREDLLEIFMDGQGLESLCDYCHKVWKLTDEEVRVLLKVDSTLQ